MQWYGHGSSLLCNKHVTHPDLSPERQVRCGKQEYIRELTLRDNGNEKLHISFIRACGRLYSSTLTIEHAWEYLFLLVVTVIFQLESRDWSENMDIPV